MRSPTRRRALVRNISAYGRVASRDLYGTTPGVPLVFDAVLPNRPPDLLPDQKLECCAATSRHVTVVPPGRSRLKKTKCVVAVSRSRTASHKEETRGSSATRSPPSITKSCSVPRRIFRCISFDPPVLEYPTLLVNTTASKALIIINSSDCAIKYSLIMCRGARFAVGEEPEQTIRQLRVPSEGKSEDPVEAVGGLAGNENGESHVSPDAAGDFEFACACKVHAVDEDGNEIALDPEQASLLTLGEEARDVELVRGRDPFSATVAELSKKSPALPLTCVVKGSASFPTIIVRDIRVEGAKLGCSTSAMWAHFH